MIVLNTIVALSAKHNFIKRDTTASEIKEKIDDALNTVEQFKTDHNEAIKKGEEKSAEHEEKIDKMFQDITVVMELKNRVEALETMKNEAISKDDQQKELEQKQRDCFEEFAARGEQGQFNDYIRRENAELYEELKAMSVNSDIDGGFLVIPEIGAPEKTRYFETSPIRTVARAQTISSDTFQFVAKDGARIGAQKVTETQARPTTGTRQISEKKIPTHEIYSYPEVTQKMIDDSQVNILDWISEDTNEDFTLFENTSFVSGTGVGEARGFLTYPAWAVVGTYEKEKIEQINSGAAGAFTADGIIDLQNSLQGIYQPNAVFMVKRTAFKDIAKLKTGDGEYLFNRNLDRNVGEPFNLLNRKVMFADDLPVVAANSLSLVYGDFRRGYMIVDRIGIRTLRDPYTNKPYIGFYSTKRYGGDVYNWEAIKIQKLAV